MKKIFTFILHWFVVICVMIAHIGISISKVYCAHCESAHAYVSVITAEDSKCCKETCNCCKTNCPETDCKYQEDEVHEIYRLTDSYEVEEKLHLEVASFALPAQIILIPVYEAPVVSSLISFREKIPDRQPSRELLCTFNC